MAMSTLLMLKVLVMVLQVVRSIGRHRCFGGDRYGSRWNRCGRNYCSIASGSNTHVRKPLHKLAARHFSRANVVNHLWNGGFLFLHVFSLKYCYMLVISSFAVTKEQ